MDDKTIKVKKTKNVKSRLIDANTLENPQSRQEMYLHFISRTGRITFDQLPKPQSRIEFLLMYLCEQIHQENIGGGGITLPIRIEDVEGLEESLTDLVSKTKKNIITGETLLTDGYILGDVISKLDNQQTNMNSARLPHHMGHKAARVTPSQTLTHITIAIHNNVPVGTRIDGIKVGAINVNNNRISQYVVENATAYVQENKNTQLTNCTRSVVVTLPQPFTPTEESWFCITCLNAAWGERATGGTGDACSEQSDMPAVGSAVRAKASGYVGKYLLHSDKVSLNDLVNMANGSVNTVNRQRQDRQGNVNIGIQHIEGLEAALDNTITLGARLGELKALIYDAGEQFESGGRTWLRCDGQTIDVSQLNGGIEGSSVNSNTITLPTSGNGEYKYICIA